VVLSEEELLGLNASTQPLVNQKIRGKKKKEQQVGREEEKDPRNSKESRKVIYLPHGKTRAPAKPKAIGEDTDNPKGRRRYNQTRRKKVSGR